MKARDVMTTPVLTVELNTPLDDAARLMIRHRVNSLPVTDDELRLLGVVTETDVFRGLALRMGIGLSPTAHLDESHIPRRVADVGHPAAQWVDADVELTHCLSRMARGNGQSLPVLDAGRVVGIIGRREAINALELIDPAWVDRRVAQGQIPQLGPEQVSA